MGVALALALLLPLAAAHASPERVFPGMGARLPASPAEAWVEFTEAPDPSSVTLAVLDRAHESVATGAPRVEGARATIALRPDLPDGAYLVKWSFANPTDGHRVSGAWSFGVGDAAAARVEAAGEDAFPWGLAAGKALAFAGLAMVCGAVATRAYVLPPAARAALAAPLARFERAGAAAQVAGLLLFLAAQAGGDALAYATGTAFGRGLLLRTALAAATLAWAFAPRPAWGLRVDLALAAASLGAYGASAHVATLLGPLAVGAAVDAVHLAAVLAWTGGLACLALLLRADAADAKLAVEASRRFSRLATACVSLMAATGVLMLVAVLGLDLRAWPEQLRAPYGRFLLAMTVLGAAMMGLGAINRYRFLARFVASPGKERRRAFRGRVARESALGLVVLLLAAVVTNLSPAEAVGAEVSRPCEGEEDLVGCYADVLRVIQAERGPDEAFGLLLAMAERDPSLVVHLHAIAHELGAHMLTLYGDIQETLSRCPFAASQGCLDGATEAHLAAAPALDAATIRGVCHAGNAYWNFTCNHGIGHGLLQAKAYDLGATLPLCDVLDESNRGFCYEGAIMEYTMAYTENLMHHGDGDPSAGIERRLDDPYYPCNQMVDPYARSCWLYQGQIVLYLNDEDLAAAFAACSAAPAHDDTCTVGLGSVAAARSGMDPAAATASCALAPTDLRGACLDGFLAWALGEAGDPMDGLRVCRGIAEAQKGACYSYLGLNLIGMLGPADVARLCAQADRGHEAACRQGAGL